MVHWEFCTAGAGGAGQGPTCPIKAACDASKALKSRELSGFTTQSPRCFEIRVESGFVSGRKKTWDLCDGHNSSHPPSPTRQPQQHRQDGPPSRSLLPLLQEQGESLKYCPAGRRRRVEGGILGGGDNDEVTGRKREASDDDATKGYSPPGLEHELTSFSRTPSRASTVVSPTPRSASLTWAASVPTLTTSLSAFTSSPTSMNRSALRP